MAAAPWARHHTMLDDTTDEPELDETAHGSRHLSAAVPSSAYYHKTSSYHGQQLEHLAVVESALRSMSSPSRPALYLVGDSSFDNKYWFDDKVPSVNGFEAVLSGSGRTRRSKSWMKPDIAYQLNKALAEANGEVWGGRPFCLNCAVEESTLSDRFSGALLNQDEFVRDHLTPADVVAISVGGNDIALRPSFGTIVNMLALLAQPHGWIESGWCIGLGHFRSLFKRRVEDYIQALTAKTKPRLVVVCMIYYLDEVPGGSWADGVLSKLGYDKNPAKLQMLIRKIFADATSKIVVDGVEVLPFPLFEVLDGKTSADYCQRVEPSPSGGAKIAAALTDAIAARLADTPAP